MEALQVMLDLATIIVLWLVAGTALAFLMGPYLKKKGDVDN